MKLKTLFLFAVLLMSCEKPQPLLGDVHEHADFKVYLNGTAYDFAQDKYMSTADHKLSNFTHLHDGEGDIVHKHMTTITLGDLFQSLGMRFDENCFMTDELTEYCTDGEKTLKFYVNGKENDEFGEYEIRDLDEILISYGNETEEEIQAQLDSVTDKACIQSKKCPERGEPSDESDCLTGEDCTAL